MWKSSNLSFSLCPLLTQGAVEALLLRGSDALKAGLPAEDDRRQVDRDDEPHRAAGRVGPVLVRTRAERRADQYLISGQKDLHHLRRARPGGQHRPPGARAHAGRARRREGDLAFRRAEVHPGRRRQAGKRNSAKCASIEHKLGIHASPTAVMVYDQAAGYLVGEENRGLEYMFIMMNAARFAVGLEGRGENRT